jgi:hypothetical protein
VSSSTYRRDLLIALPAVAVMAARPGRAQSLQDVDARETALIEVWEKTPLTIREAVFVARAPAGYGMEEPRPNNVFKSGEPLVTYIEPIGYGWRALDPHTFEFGFDVDFVIKSKDGDRVLAEQKNFGHLVEHSQLRNLEFMVTLTLNLTGAPPGDYILAYTLRDVTGPKAATCELPFTIAA